jgi:hypothetical protein
MAASPVVAAGSLLVAVVAMTSSAEAAEWYLNSRARQDLSYDDNIGLRSANDEKIAAFGETSSIGAAIGGRSPSVDIGLDTLFNFTRFPSESRLNSNDQYFTLGSAYTGERLTAQLKAQYIRDTTRTSDIEDSGLFILQNRRREVRRLAPRLAYQLTPVDEVSVDGDISDTYYPSGDIRNFEQWGGTGTWTKSIGERTQLLASLSGFKVNSNDSGSQNTTYYAAQVGFGHVLSEKLRVRLVAGPTLARVNIVSSSAGFRFASNDTTLGYGFDGTVDYRYHERLSLQGRMFRTVRPSSTTGVVLEETGFRASGRFALLQHVSLDLATLYLLREAVGETDPSGRRDFVSIEPALVWRLAEDWDLRLGYRYRWQRFDDADEDPDASSNAVLGALTYRLPPLSMSR